MMGNRHDLHLVLSFKLDIILTKICTWLDILSCTYVKKFSSKIQGDLIEDERLE